MDTSPSSDHAVSLPARVLRPYIAHYAGYYANGLAPGTHAGLPSRHVHIFISLDQPIDIVRMPRPSERAAAFMCFVNGLQDAPAVVRNASSVHGMHVFLTPFGVRALLGAAPADLASCVLDLSDFWGRSAHGLIDRLRSAATWRNRFAILDDVFSKALRPFATPNELLWAWSRLAQARGSISIQNLADDVGWSRRHFSEQFRCEIGVTPKTAARIFRFEHACALLKKNPRSLAQVAFDCGFHDQAHMNREWNSLADCTPKNWIAGQLPFVQDYELAGCDDVRQRSAS
jgi:AraC-like DNA-binding protein